MKEPSIYEQGDINWQISPERQKYHYVESYDAEYFFKNAKVLSISEVLALNQPIHDKWHSPERTRRFLESLVALQYFKEGVVCAQMEKHRIIGGKDAFGVWYGTLYVVIATGKEVEFKKFLKSTRMAPQEFNTHGEVLGNPVYRLWWD